jgi:hypothetical protein
MTEHDIAKAIAEMLWQKNILVECEIVTYDDGELGNQYNLRGNGVYLSFEQLGFMVYNALDILVEKMEEEE